MIVCPICSSKDNCKFVFVEHQLDNGVLEISNPSDYHFLYVCPNLHVHDSKEIVLRHDLGEDC